MPPPPSQPPPSRWSTAPILVSFRRARERISGAGTSHRGAIRPPSDEPGRAGPGRWPMTKVKAKRGQRRSAPPVRRSCSGLRLRARLRRRRRRSSRERSRRPNRSLRGNQCIIGSSHFSDEPHRIAGILITNPPQYFFVHS